MERWIRSRAQLASGLLALGLVFSACADSTTHTPTDPVDQEPDRPDGPDVTPEVGNQYLMVPNGARERVVGAGATVPLGITLIDKDTEAPVAEESISYTILEGEGLGSLTALNSTTDADGIATIDVRTMEQVGTVRVEVDHPSATAVEFSVTIEPRPVGNIDVELSNASPSIMTLRDVEVRLYRAQGYSCNEFLPLRPAARGHRSSQMAATPAESVAFDGLDITHEYMVTAVARGAERGQLAAGGCVEDIRVASMTAPPWMCRCNWSP